MRCLSILCLVVVFSSAFSIIRHARKNYRQKADEAIKAPADAKSADPQCECKPESVWTDVIIAIEAGVGMTDRGLQDVLGYVQSTFSWFDIQKSTSHVKMSMRAGLILYGNNLTVLYPLGSLDNDELASLDRLPYMGERNTNIEGAITAAVHEFQSSAHRQNSRKVLVLIASTYNPSSYHAPLKAALSFQEDDGVLIVYNYVQSHSVASRNIEELASPGYYISNEIDIDAQMMLKDMCNANCYCQPDYDPYTVDPVVGIPTAGCYIGKRIQNNQAVANNNCAHYYNGTVAMGKTEQKTDFIAQRVANNNFWGGIVWSHTSTSWVWMDGSQVSGNYQPWLSAQPEGHEDDNDCVYVSDNGTDQTWIPTSCRQGLMYACQVRACDSTNYCQEEA